MRACIIVMLSVLLAAPAAALDPGAYDITVYANEDYVLNLTHKASGIPVNLTGYQYKLQARKASTSPVFATFSSSIVNAAAGQTRHKLSRRYTADRVNNSGIYDLMETAPGGTVSYRMMGKIRILETVTR